MQPVEPLLCCERIKVTNLVNVPVLIASAVYYEERCPSRKSIENFNIKRKLKIENFIGLPIWQTTSGTFRENGILFLQGTGNLPYYHFGQCRVLFIKVLRTS
jgi:hypothetical protein